MTNVKPIPTINGFTLPLVTAVLLLRVNDPNLLEPAFRNKTWLNILSLLIVGLTAFLGLHNLWLAAGKLFPMILEQFALNSRVMINLGVSLLVILELGWKLKVGFRNQVSGFWPFTQEAFLTPET